MSGNAGCDSIRTKLALAESARAPAQGRLDLGPPIAVIDIGSNSVRLVVYEGLTRSPTPLFNEKVLAGLGSAVQSTKMLAPDAMDRAFAALRRFRSLCDLLQVGEVLAVATAACRDAENGPGFLAEAERICRTKIELLTGEREAELAALGVMSGVQDPDGLVGDFGGGSLELVDIRGEDLHGRVTLPLGGLALRDRAGLSLQYAESIVADTLADVPGLRNGAGRPFYAVGGTWRALARLHMTQTGYPLRVTHGYVMEADQVFELSRLLRKSDHDMLLRSAGVSEARRPLLAYGALVLEALVRRAAPSRVVISVLGLREGLLYALLSADERRKDPLLTAARELNTLRSRAPQHGEELILWTDRFMQSSSIDETAEEERLRHAVCLVADIGWRAHPDYRGEQSLNIIAHASFIGIDHPGRAFIALSVFYRHVGLMDEELSPRLRALASPRMLDRARILGAAMRVAYLVSAAMPDVLPQAPLRIEGKRLVLKLPSYLKDLDGERVFNRLRKLANLIDCEPATVRD